MASRKPKRIAVFAEDRGHEEFLRAVLERLAAEVGEDLEIRVQSARGGHARALAELALFQKVLIASTSELPVPDLIVVGIDSNCQKVAAVRQGILKTLELRLATRTIIACAEPHIERWYLADPEAFSKAVGPAPRVGKTKCEKDKYKAILARAVSSAGRIAPLRGLEFAREVVGLMDWYRAGKAVSSFRRFLVDLRSGLKGMSVK